MRPEQSEKNLVRLESAHGSGLPASFKTDEALQFFLRREPNCAILNLADLQFIERQQFVDCLALLKLKSLSLRGLKDR